jgi:hypothetical protein
MTDTNLLAMYQRATDLERTWRRWLEKATKSVRMCKESLEERDGKTNEQDDWINCKLLLKDSEKLAVAQRWDFIEGSNLGVFLERLLRDLEQTENLDVDHQDMIPDLQALISELTGEIPGEDW